MNSLPDHSGVDWLNLIPSVILGAFPYEYWFNWIYRRQRPYYSFSSIINGYNREQYPEKWQVILNYLDSKPSVDFIKGHSITHIYCEDYSESLLIAASSNIPNVVIPSMICLIVMQF